MIRVAARRFAQSPDALTRLIFVLAIVCSWPASSEPANSRPANAAALAPRAELALRHGKPLVRAELLVHPDDLASSTLRAGVHLEIAPGWHIYGGAAGESGLPTELSWSSIEGTIESRPWPPTSMTARLFRISIPRSSKNAGRPFQLFRPNPRHQVGSFLRSRCGLHTALRLYQFTRTCRDAPA